MQDVAYFRTFIDNIFYIVFWVNCCSRKCFKSDFSRVECHLTYWTLVTPHSCHLDTENDGLNDVPSFFCFQIFAVSIHTEWRNYSLSPRHSPDGNVKKVFITQLSALPLLASTLSTLIRSYRHEHTFVLKLTKVNFWWEPLLYFIDSTHGETRRFAHRVAK